VRVVNNCRRVILRYLKDCGDPQKPQATGADETDHHWNNRVTDPSERSDHDIHHPADGVGSPNDQETLHACLNDLRAGGINA
ncbi:hypothetical protein LI165_12830, partial [Phascolarctobacterium faecium]|uniref:hypothetical protein n=1 Tax=Phascolarctobacterium faecium TaxID=33025 RepID=UPI001D087115